MVKIMQGPSDKSTFESNLKYILTNTENLTFALELENIHIFFISFSYLIHSDPKFHFCLFVKITFLPLKMNCVLRIESNLFFEHVLDDKRIE